ncbi:hypothetical protein N7468_005354 [Penicillium chermesinum]|uniref:C2H2-type domain-containing protein n=1 Tax=Penicillium chermesinum TaxID=63820 RepID=A0A9W9NZ32_9EURO|nr:uncharacterized protein N7468_005354 [Penicillium chermesinum]KAJ5232398.1 hypothetical protein N7468_005354 [Penicillium chermesinum]KAJ6172055.1 hypothetical protein N7470_001122 [Penicillium chermesinum]
MSLIKHLVRLAHLRAKVTFKGEHRNSRLHCRDFMLISTSVEGLECKWEGCTYKGNFGSRGALERHVKALHTNTQEFKCPDCDFVNGRRDKLQEHQRRKKHGNYIRLS